MSVSSPPQQSGPSPRMWRFCVSSLLGYPLFDAGDQRPIGGAETHAWLLARELARRNQFEVDYVVRSALQFDRHDFGPVRVWNIGDGLDAQREVVTRWRNRSNRADWPLLWSALAAIPKLVLGKLARHGRPVADGTDMYRQLDSDCYFCFGVSLASLVVIRSAHRLRRPAVLFLEADSDVDARFRPDSTYQTPTGELAVDCAATLAEADMIIAQSVRQQTLLSERFGRSSHVLPNPFDLPLWDHWARQPRQACHIPLSSPYWLWIGRADEHHKRPQLCLELARRVPEARFLMILNPFDPAVEQAIQRAKPTNVEIVERFPFQQMPIVFSHACGYVSTGSREFEGSPNVFLQAAAAGVPIASLEVDGDILLRTTAGRNLHGDFDALTDLVRQIWNGDNAAKSWGPAGRRYLESHHAPAGVVDELLSRLSGLETLPMRDDVASPQQEN